MNVVQTEMLSFLSLNSAEFVIPVYQRNYAWQKKHCQQLLEDILEVADKDKQHFLGTITYIMHYDGGNRAITIIDGQQRVTTIMLLLKALLDHKRVERGDEIYNEISRYLQSDNDKTRLRLKPIKKDRAAFESVMKYSSGAMPSGASNVLDNYRFFKTKTAGYTKLQIKQILNSFWNLQIAEVTLDQKAGDDPQMVFERINATGLHLEDVDLIRNYLMMELNPDEQERIFDSYWAQIEDEFAGEKDNDGAIKKFIITYLRLYYGANFKDNNEDMYERFKALRRDYFAGSSDEILRDLVKFARLYGIVTDESRAWNFCGEVPSQKHALREKINVFGFIGLGVATPFLMQLIDAFESGRLGYEDFDEMLNLAISFATRREICSLPTPPLTKIFYGLYKRLNDNGELNAQGLAKYLGTRSGGEIFPTAQMLETAFETQSVKSKYATLILREIERQKNANVAALEALKCDEIYPKKPTKEWREMAGDEASEIEQNFIGTIGNLILGEGGNAKSFADKIAAFEQSGKFELNRRICACEHWGVAQIKERAAWLFTRFGEVEIFKDVGAQFRQSNDNVTLDSDWTGKKARQLILPDGSTKAARAFTDVATAVVDYLIANCADGVEQALGAGLACVKFGEVERKDGAFVRDFGEFSFVCGGAAESIRQAVKKFVEACGLEADDFEVVVF